jgi:hypothetical protein
LKIPKKLGNSYPIDSIACNKRWWLGNSELVRDNPPIDGSIWFFGATREKPQSYTLGSFLFMDGLRFQPFFMIPKSAVYG